MTSSGGTTTRLDEDDADAAATGEKSEGIIYGGGQTGGSVTRAPGQGIVRG